MNAFEWLQKLTILGRGDNQGRLNLDIFGLRMGMREVPIIGIGTLQG